MANQIIEQGDSNDENKLLVTDNSIENISGKRKVQIGGLVTVVTVIVILFLCIVRISSFFNCELYRQ